MKNGLNLTTWAKLSNPKAHQAHKYNTKSKKKKMKIKKERMFKYIQEHEEYKNNPRNMISIIE
jgi:hypothetical protein